MHPTVWLWLIGLILIIISWYIPNSGGYLIIGVITLAFGIIWGLRSRSEE